MKHRLARFPLGYVAAVTVLAHCGGGGMGGPSGMEVATVSVTLPGTILIGDSVQAIAVPKDASGNPLNVPIETWLSSNPSIAQVTPTGWIVGGMAGGPVTVTAYSGKGSGSAPVSVADDQRFGYAWADQPLTAGYTPDPAYRYNSSGGAIEITRSSTGVYSVRFAGLGRTPPQRENLQVTGYGGAAGGFCKLGGWQSVGSDLVVETRCFTAPGQPADGRYTVLVSGAKSVILRLGFALSADLQAGGTLDKSTTHNSANGAVSMSRIGPGNYLVTFTGLQRVQGLGPETVLVSAVGVGPERCHVEAWDQTIGTVNVSCTGTNGAGADSRFSVLWISRGRPPRFGYAWTGMESSTTDYPPDSRFALSSNGGAITAQRLGVGQYRLVFAGLGKVPPATETVLISAYGAADHTCTTTSWGTTGANDLSILLHCYDPAGAPADSRYQLLWVQ